MACLSIPCMTCRCTICNRWYRESSGTARNHVGRWLLWKPLPVKDFRTVSNGPGRSNVFHQCSTRPVDLEQACLGIGKDPDPVPAPFAGAVAAPASFRACHHSIPLSMMDCTICTLGSSRNRGILRQSWPARPSRSGRIAASDPEGAGPCAFARGADRPRGAWSVERDRARVLDCTASAEPHYPNMQRNRAPPVLGLVVFPFNPYRTARNHSIFKVSLLKRQPLGGWQTAEGPEGMGCVLANTPDTSRSGGCEAFADSESRPIRWRS